MAIGVGAQRIYQAGFQAAAQEAQVRELKAKEQAQAWLQRVSNEVMSWR
jgi:hypothetical protein